MTSRNKNNLQKVLVELSAVVLATMEGLRDATKGAHGAEWEAAIDAIAVYLVLVLSDSEPH